MQVATQFKVVSVSSNTNSFGLHGVILMEKNGNAFEVGISGYNCPKKGDILNGSVRATDGFISGLSVGTYEIPRSLGIAPQSVANKVWEASTKTATV